MAAKSEYPTAYQIYTHPVICIFYGGLFACWWFFLAYMITISSSKGTVPYILLVGGLFAGIYLVSSLIRSKFTVRGTTITRSFIFRAPKTYDISEISKIVIHHVKGTGYRVYIGEKKIFTLDSGMVNLGLFLETLTENHVPFSGSVL